jgi:hypothetical protein
MTASHSSKDNNIQSRYDHESNYVSPVYAALLVMLQSVSLSYYESANIAESMSTDVPTKRKLGSSERSTRTESCIRDAGNELRKYGAYFVGELVKVTIISFHYSTSW